MEKAPEVIAEWVKSANKGLTEAEKVQWDNIQNIEQQAWHRMLAEGL